MSSLFFLFLAALLLALLLAGVAQPAVPVAARRYASVRGERVAYSVAGEGEPTLVFVHGWGGSGDFWRANAPAFAGQRVVLLDLPGHRASDAPAVNYTMKFFAEAVAAVMQDAGVARAVFVAHSLGTAVVCRFLRDHPEQVAALVTVDGALFGYDVTIRQREELLARFRGADYRAEVTKFVNALFRQRADPTLRERVCGEILRTPQHVLVSAFAGLLDAAAWEPAAIPVPLLMLNAPSPLWDAAYLARVRKLAPDLEYRLVRGAGHFLMLEQPAEFHAALAEFLARLPEGQA